MAEKEMKDIKKAIGIIAYALEETQITGTTPEKLKEQLDEIRMLVG